MKRSDTKNTRNQRKSIGDAIVAAIVTLVIQTLMMTAKGENEKWILVLVTVKQKRSAGNTNTRNENTKNTKEEAAAVLIVISFNHFCTCTSN